MTRAPLIVALLVASATVGAQSTPPIARVKLVATHAVNQTNAATSTMTGEPLTLADSGRGVHPATVEAVRQPSSAAPLAAALVPSAAPRTASPAPSATVAPRPGAPFEREVFEYDRAGRRDPFISLMATGELRPLVSDLRLVAVAYDAGGGHGSVAVLRDINTKDQYRIRVGQTLGRMRVAAINPKSVTFTIEEFGFSRQEELGLGDSNKGSLK